MLWRSKNSGHCSLVTRSGQRLPVGKSALLCYGRDCYRHSIDPRKVIAEGLQYPSLALSLVLQLVEVLGEQIAYRLRRFELQWQHAFGGEDSQDHLDAMLQLLRS